MTAIAIASVGCEKTTLPPTGVVVNSPVHDFGECRAGDKLSHTFVVTNQMDVPVKIMRATSSCTCTVVGENGHLPDTSILPHATLRIPVRFSIVPGQEVAAGNVLVLYRAETDAADCAAERFFALRLRAHVIPDYRITPREVDFGEIDGLTTQCARRTLRLTPEAGKRVTIKQIRATRDFLTAHIVPKGRSFGGYDITVELHVSGFSRSQSVTGSLVLLTDSKQLPETMVSVRAKYVAPATIDPTMIVIGSDVLGQVVRKLRICSSGPSRIRAVTSDTDAIRVEFDAQRKSRKHCLRVALAPNRQTEVDDAVRIELELFPDDGSRILRVFSVPVHRFVARGEGR